MTKAARNFADCVNRVHDQNISFTLLKNGVPFALLVPETRKKPCTGREIARALDAVKLSANDARAWSRDLRMARRRLKDQADKWE